MAYFECVFGGAIGASIPLIVTCDSAFAGQTIICTDGTKTLTQTCPSTSPYEVEFMLPNIGTWIISGVVEGATYSQQVVITNFDVTLIVGFDFRQWLTLGGLDPTDYSNLDDVFDDEAAVRRLMTIHASADYLIDCVTDKLNDIDAFCANDIAMKWIGLRDYVCDGLTAITGVEAKFLASQYWERYLKDHVPAMTSNTAPYGTVTPSTTMSGNDGYYAFDDNDSTAWLAGAANGYLTYTFTNPVCVKEVSFIAAQSSPSNIIRVKNYSIVASNDNFTTSTTLYTGVAEENANVQTVNIDNNEYYLYYRFVIADTYRSDVNAGLTALQFYGRSLNVSVPVMTSNTAPYGEVIYSAQSTNSRNYAYKAFDGSASSLWASGSNDVPQYIGYAFDTEVKIKKVLASFSSHNVSATYDIQASNDGINYYDLATGLTATGSTVVVSDIVSNNTYKYYRINITSQNRGSNTVGLISTLQFYGVDYSEREFAEGSTMKYLYDHGVEFETISYDTPNGYSGYSTAVPSHENTGDYLRIYNNGSKVMSLFRTASQIDLSPYSVATMKLNADNTNSYGTEGEFSISSTVKWAAHGGVAYTNLNSNNYQPGINVSSINQAVYIGGIGWNDSHKWEANISEWWLE